MGTREQAVLAGVNFAGDLRAISVGDRRLDERVLSVVERLATAPDAASNQI